MRVILLLFITMVLLPDSTPWFYGRWIDKKERIRIQNETIYRLLAMMQSYYSAGDARIKRLNPQRAYYEETQEFEEGYIMGEIIERYRLMVENTKISKRMKNYVVFDVLNRLELVQRLHLEVFHLVNMLYEVPRKYGQQSSDEEEVPEAKIPSEKIESGAMKEFISQADKRQKEKRDEEKKRKKAMKKMREEMIRNNRMTTSKVTRPTNNHWQIDYGWEIDYRW